MTQKNSDFELVSHLVEPSGIAVHHARDLDTARRILSETGSQVLLTESRFGSYTWEDARNMVESFPYSVALVVVADEVDRRFWLDVLERGGYDLIPRAFAATELRHVLESAKLSAVRQLRTGSA